MTASLCGAFLLSGVAALLFESLWFRLAGLALGNGVWASATVLASFMAGLALGNLVAARHGERVVRPLRAYAALEAAVAVTGVGLVLGLPAAAAGLGPALGPLRESPPLLHAARGALAFALMLLPATALGTTLPLLARALARDDARFGVALGRLYGSNTLGGVAGAVAGEAWLVPRLGLSGTAAVAALLNLTAAAVALRIDRPVPARSSPPGPGALWRTPRAARLLVAAFLGGGILLALEVVWFRLLQMFVFGTQLAFALMLAAVLAGIGAGGLLAAAWLRRRPGAAAALPAVALAAGIATILAYAALEPWRVPALAARDEVVKTVWLALALVLPTSLASGLLFTLLGAALRAEVDGAAGAAGLLTLANTLGAALGAPLAGLVLLGSLGAERSVLALALAYAAAAAALAPWGRGAGRRALAGAAAALALCAALFPFGLMEGRFVRGLMSRQGADGSRLVALREGLTETVLLLQRDWGGRPLYQKLVTNAHSMTSSYFYGRRYMKLFAWWPLAVRPGARRALLISYGIGNTAEALVRSRSLEQIDVVDVSATILGLSPLVFRGGAGDPLRDPRVRVHVEDGRFHLLSGRDAYDVITAEPPPPRGAGVVNLYTLEYFRLVRSRLAPRGVATHWLPVNQLSLADARGIVSAFCSAFEDCTLWSGAGYDWMLAGTNGLEGPAGEDGLARPWREDGDELRELGIETPEDLAALFIADADGLREWTAGAPPLADDRPGRLSFSAPPPADADAFRRFQDASVCAARFRASRLVPRFFPPGLRERALPAFEWRGVLDRDYDDGARPEALADLWAVLERSRRRTLPLLLLGSEPRVSAIARLRHAEGRRHPMLAFHLGAAALAGRDYEGAARLFEEARTAGTQPGGFHPPGLLRASSLGLAGRREEALVLALAIDPGSLPGHARPWRDWLIARLGGSPGAGKGAEGEAP